MSAAELLAWLKRLCDIYGECATFGEVFGHGRVQD